MAARISFSPFQSQERFMTNVSYSGRDLVISKVISINFSYALDYWFAICWLRSRVVFIMRNVSFFLFDFLDPLACSFQNYSLWQCNETLIACRLTMKHVNYCICVAAQPGNSGRLFIQSVWANLDSFIASYSKYFSYSLRIGQRSPIFCIVWLAMKYFIWQHLQQSSDIKGYRTHFFI